jgi:hypothetical protein
LAGRCRHRNHEPNRGLGELLKITDMDVRAMDLIGYNRVAATLAGDFNFDGVVDAADYLLCRKTNGAPVACNIWRGDFGQANGNGAGANASEAVPEPTTVVLLLTILVAADCNLRRGRSA